VQAPNTDHADDGMQISARLTSSQIRAGRDQDLAVTITAPRAHGEGLRPPLSVAIVIDRSASMNGEPLANATAAAAKLVDQLDAGDAFAIVTYSSSDETVMAMARATPANKAAAYDALRHIVDAGGTCISCGLTRGSTELARTPIQGGLQRIVLISDGQANEGLWDRGELMQLAGNIASNGVSVSALGVGLDFDELTMVQLAQVGRGNYYFVEDTRNLGAMFARELGGLAETVAADVQLVLDAGPGVEILEVYGYPSTRAGSQVVVPVADLRAGETRKVVVRASVGPQHVGPAVVATARLGWRRVADGAQRTASATAEATVVEDETAVIRSVDRSVVESVEQALAGRALEQASEAYERQGAEAAQQVIERRLDDARANGQLDAKALEHIEAQAVEAVQSFQAAKAGGTAGMKAKKVSRVKAYELAR